MDRNQPEPDADWIEGLRTGDESAVERLVDVFYERLVGLARFRLAGMPQQVADDEGAVISALRSFFSGIGNGQLPRISDGNDLWRVLATITARKAVRQLRVYFKQSGEGGQVKRNFDLQQLVSNQPSPESATQLLDEFQQRLDLLGDDSLKKVVLMKLEGFENAEIAAQLSIHIRSVQRKLKLAESIWMSDNESE